MENYKPAMLKPPATMTGTITSNHPLIFLLFLGLMLRNYIGEFTLFPSFLPFFSFIANHRFDYMLFTLAGAAHRPVRHE